MKKKIYDNWDFYLPLFFFGLYLYFSLIFDSTLYYHHHRPVFFFDRTFADQFFRYPGGLLEWVTCFLLQYLNNGFFGPLLMAAIFSAISIVLSSIFKNLSVHSISPLLALLPFGFLLALQNDYDTPLIPAARYLISITCFLFYVRIAKRFKIIVILASALIYYVVGGWAFLFYILLCVLYDIFYYRNYIHAGANIAMYLLYPLIAARYIFVIPVAEAYLYYMPYEYYQEPFLFKPGAYFFLSFLFLPVLLTAVLIPARKGKRNHKKSRFLWLSYRPIQSLVVALGICVFLMLSFQRDRKREIKIDFYAEHGRWQDLLSLSSEIRIYDRLVNYDVNRALYHTGQLLDNMFSYRQLLGSDALFITRVFVSSTAIHAVDLYYELGHINAAQAMAYEGQTKFKYDPRILKRLVLTNIINGHYSSAAKFVTLLKKSPVFKNWAQKYEIYLDDMSLIENDREIRLKRLLKPKFDFFINADQPNYDLNQLLRSNPANQMAFEYLMAYYLLECKLGNLKRYADRYKNTGRGEIPRHIEEALLFIKAASPPDMVFDLAEYDIRPQTMDRFKRFYEILYQHRRDPEKARQLLRMEFIDTYWYYIRFVYPEQSNVELQKRRIDERLF